MPLFPSHEWMAAYCAELAAHPDADDVAGALDGVYRFVVEPGGPLRERHTYNIAVRPSPDGEAPTVELVGDEATPRLTLAADYPRWRQLVLGQLDVAMAVMLRRVKVSGDLSRLVGSVSSAQPLVQALQRIDTQWLEER
jgi:hypothetical protein